MQQSDQPDVVSNIVPKDWFTPIYGPAYGYDNSYGAGYDHAPAPSPPVPIPVIGCW
jgi:hypothetical protein